MQPEQTDTGTDIDDSAVTRYLTRNPDYFVNNKEILSRLRIPHDTGKAVSLIEKQVSVLRGKCGHLENSLRDLIAVARENEHLHQRLHVLIQDIISAPSLGDIVALTKSTLRDSFNAEDVHLLLIAKPPKRASRKKKAEQHTVAKSVPTARTNTLEVLDGALLVRHTDKRIKHFADVFSGGSTVCGMPSDNQLKAMIGKDHAHVASAAMIPLHYERKLGVIMLTSRDESRFGAGKGVMFLNQLGELLSRRVHSYAAHAETLAEQAVK